TSNRLSKPAITRSNTSELRLPIRSSSCARAPKESRLTAPGPPPPPPRRAPPPRPPPARAPPPPPPPQQEGTHQSIKA
ncbi:hypothetical protein I5L43_16705, partial [Serratia marcescens]|nr:hypothetical protein [Serratia marcescens]